MVSRTRNKQTSMQNDTDTDPDTERRPFYMVHVHGKNAPVVFHDTFDSAAAEAERLALKENTTIVVLQGVAICVPPEPAAVSWEFANNVTIAQKDEAPKDTEVDEAGAKFKEVLDLLFPTR